jgi:ERCC4-type nuclease
MLWFDKQWIGVQRKEVSDLLSSVADGRLGKGCQQMQTHCGIKVLIIEGDVRWTNNGEMMGRGEYGRKWTRKQWKGLLWSVRMKGIWVEFSDDIADTVEQVLWLKEWQDKGTHRALDTRPGPSSVWGNPRNEDYQRHLVQGLPGVGYELAERIVGKFGVPFTWSVSVEDLMTVPGIGRVKAEKIWAGLETVTGA